MKFLWITMLFASLAYAKEERVGGNYKVAGIKRLAKGHFEIVFESVVKTNRFDYLKLYSDHVHVAVEEGQTLRLSAEVLSVKGDTAEVSQVLLFVPATQGYTPIWMISRRGYGQDLKADRYLKMHAPQSDYRVL